MDEFTISTLPPLTNKVNFNIYPEDSDLFNKHKPDKINQSHIHHINKTYLHHLQHLSSIPRKLHISWPDKHVLQSNTKVIQMGLKSFVNLNPKWKLIIHTDDEIESYLRSKLNLTDYNLIKNRHIVEKVDLWRLLIIYFEGGLYADIDRLFNIKMDDVIDKNTKLLLPTHYNINFAQDFLCSAPLNELFKLAIEMNLSKRRILVNKGLYNETGSTLEFILKLGPETFYEAVTKTLFDVVIYDGGDYPDLNEPVVDKMRIIINESKYINTYMETWCDTMVYHTDNKAPCMDVTKEDLWEETNNKKHWELEVERPD